MRFSRCGVIGSSVMAPGIADGILDRVGDRGADAGDAALAGALDAERIEVGREILGQDDLDRRRLAGGRQQVVGEASRHSGSPCSL